MQTTLLKNFIAQGVTHPEVGSPMEGKEGGRRLLAALPGARTVLPAAVLLQESSDCSSQTTVLVLGRNMLFFFSLPYSWGNLSLEISEL